MIDSLEEDIFKNWIENNADRLVIYNNEIASYEHIPECVHKSADQFILEILEKFKSLGVKKPATKLFEILKLVYIKMKVDRPFVAVLFIRMAENMDLLDKFREGFGEEKIESGQELKLRGFM